MTVLYHHTDAARLPWIIKAGELQPRSNSIGGFPDPDFLWATTDAQGDGTASGGQRGGYRTGDNLIVRFALKSEDFMPWADVPANFPAWKPNDIERLEKVARSQGVKPSTWWCRAEPLKVDAATPIEFRSYANNRWVALSDRDVRERVGGLSLMLGARMAVSLMFAGPNGADGFDFKLSR